MVEEGQERFGPYRIVRRLGVGGMAETFEAVRVDPSGFEQRVCLKRVLPAFRRDPAFIERFDREALLAARLRHSNVVAVIDFGADDGVPYMALELVDGPDLRSFLATMPGTRLPVRLALLVASDVAMALAYAHAPAGDAPGVVHRDVSPSNVLLGRSGDVKLADFGIAKAMDGAAATASGEVRGKIPYMAPEQMRGQAIDGRADLFSLGVLLFEMLTGTRPFDGAHDVETMTHVLADERPRLESLLPDATPALVTLVDRLLASQPGARFPDAEAALAAIEEAGVDPRARTELARAVEHALGGMGTRMHLTGASSPPPPPTARPRPNAASEEALADTVALDPVRAAAKPAGEARHAGAERSVPRRPLGAVMAAFLLGVVVVGIAVGLGSAATPTPTATPAPSPTPTPNPTANPPPTPSATPTASPTPTPSATPSPTPTPTPSATPSPAATPIPTANASPAPERDRDRSGRVRVTVVPWGLVWIDGRAIGRAPRSVTLPPGEHRVQAGFESPTASRRVRVVAGRTSAVQIELD